MQSLEDHQVFRIISVTNYKRHRCDTCNKDYPNLDILLKDHPDFPLHKIQVRNSKNHKITKIITKKSYTYLCDKCRTSYPSKKMMLDDHPDIDLIEFSIFDKITGKTIKQSVRVSDQEHPLNTIQHNHPPGTIRKEIIH